MSIYKAHCIYRQLYHSFKPSPESSSPLHQLPILSFSSWTSLATLTIPPLSNTLSTNSIPVMPSSHHQAPSMQTRYVNIYFDPGDAYLSDIDLLRVIQDKISQGDVKITSWSAIREVRLCYSIKVTGEFYGSGVVCSQALNKVYLWIRYLSSEGLPFFRRDVF